MRTTTGVLAFLYVMATQCCQAGRTDDAVRYSDAAQLVIASGRYEEVPFGGEAVLANAYLHIGQPERSVEWCRAQLARGRDTHTVIRASLFLALTLAGSYDEAMAAANLASLRFRDRSVNTERVYAGRLALFLMR